MKVPKIILLTALITSLNVFCAQQAKPLTLSTIPERIKIAINLAKERTIEEFLNDLKEGQIQFKDDDDKAIEELVDVAAANVFEENGNVREIQNKIFEQIVKILNDKQINNILKIHAPENKVSFTLAEVKLINALLKQALVLQAKFTTLDIIHMLTIAKTIKYDLKENINARGNNTIQPWATLLQETKKIIPKLEAVLKEKMAQDIQIMEQKSIKEKLVERLNDAGMIPEILDLISQYATSRHEDALKAVVLPDIQKREESCIIL